jgi:hypothetical protein
LLLVHPLQIEDHSIVSFLPLDITNEDSLTAVLSHIDHTMQYGEDEEPKAPADLDGGESSRLRWSLGFFVAERCLLISVSQVILRVVVMGMNDRYMR